MPLFLFLSHIGTLLKLSIALRLHASTIGLDVDTTRSSNTDGQDQYYVHLTCIGLYQDYLSGT
jgi:hypothetical protein